MSTTRRVRRTTYARLLTIMLGGTLLASAAIAPARAQNDAPAAAVAQRGAHPGSQEQADRATEQAKGRLLWRFRIDSDYALAHPVVAPDGTIYLVDSSAHLYALTPDGKLKWRLDGVGDSGVALGPDGTIYVGNTVYITAVNPDGTIKWRFEQDPIAFILLGPTVGPDGNIYAVASSGLGVFSLTPEGELRWQTPEPYDRLIVENQDPVFGPGPGGGMQLYFHANKHFVAVRLDDGKVTFSKYGDGHGSCGGSDQPAVGPNGTAYTTNWQIGEGEKLGAYDPSGHLKWTFVYQPNNCNSAPDVAPNGKVYILWNATRLFVVTPKGESRELVVDNDNFLQNPSVSPGGDQIVTSGTNLNTRRGVVESFKARNGARLWRVTLPDQQGATQVPMSAFKVPFSPDGQTVYVTTIISGVYDHCFLYAVDASR